MECGIRIFFQPERPYCIRTAFDIEFSKDEVQLIYANVICKIMSYLNQECLLDVDLNQQMMEFIRECVTLRPVS
jgi:hypothetical protein